MKVKRILFLNPPDPVLLENDKSAGYAYFEPPLGLLSVYGYFKREVPDIEVLFCDANIELKFRSSLPYEQFLKKIIVDYQPQLVAIATLYYSAISVFTETARIIKSLDSSVLTVFGGHYPTHLTSETMVDRNVDFAVLSEGELGLKDLCNAINNGTSLYNVEGIAFRDNENNVVRNPRKTFWSGYERDASLPWADIPFELYFQEGRNVLYRVKEKESVKIAALTATRGCPNHCSFCSSPKFWNRRWRKREISSIITEIKYLMSNYGVNTIVFNDENIAVHKRWFLELLSEIEKLKITWISGGGLSTRAINDDEIIKKMYDSGVGLFNLAIESGSDEVLKRVNKLSSVAEANDVVAKIRKYGNGFIIGFFIVGFPFENWNGVLKTVNFAEKIDLDWKSLYCFQPFPGCELHDYCLANDLIDEFNKNYGEVYFASKVKYIDYSSEALNHLNYLSNLKFNFVNNRNLVNGSLNSLSQADRDFSYVLDMSHGHVFALWGKAQIAKKLGNQRQYEYYLKAGRESLEKNRGFWQPYMQELNISLAEQ